jgi:hypothetical protein
LKKHSTNIFVIFIAVLLIASVFIVRAIRPQNPNYIDFDSRTLTNNIWGAPPQEKLTSGVFLNRDQTFGWYWDRPDPIIKEGVNGYQPIFPNLRVGKDIGGSSNNPALPIGLESVKNLTFSVDYDYLTPPTGAYNLAYQIYFSKDINPAPEAVPHSEVMIWIHRTFGQPPDSYKGVYSDGINSYDLYSWTKIDGMNYYSFIMKGNPVFKSTHRVDAKKLLDTLSLDPKLYLLSIHFGSEVVSGAGRLQVNKLEMVINDKKL